MAFIFWICLASLIWVQIKYRTEVDWFTDCITIGMEWTLTSSKVNKKLNVEYGDWLCITINNQWMSDFYILNNSTWTQQ